MIKLMFITLQNSKRHSVNSKILKILIQTNSTCKCKGSWNIPAILCDEIYFTDKGKS